MFYPIRLTLFAATALSLSACSTMMDGEADMGGMGRTSAGAGGTVMVGGAPMYPNRTIVANAVNSRDHTTLVAAVSGGIYV